MKTFYIKTFGCQMNIYDGQRIEQMLQSRGLSRAESVADADLIILNTCSVREKATNKVFSELGRIRDKKKPSALFGIVGCVARESGSDAFRRIPELNFVLGPQSYHKLPEILENPDAKLLNIDLSGLEKFDDIFPSLGGVARSAGVGSEQNSTLPVGFADTPPKEGNLAYIPIQEGCDHCCSYCIVPFTRGRELSRPFDDVMRDVRAAAAPACAGVTGATEICFLGQNVNGYRAPRECEVLNVKCEINNSTLHISHFTLSDLIRATAIIKSVKRIRYTSSYPTEMTDELIALHGSEPKLLPFLNLPIQSGSPNVLTRMNRPYSLELYLDIINKLRAVRPDIQISSDFIVGFPGETDEDFEMTCDVARKVKFINSYSFKYSPRPHTAAAIMPEQIPENIKRQRLKILDEILTANTLKFNVECIDKEMMCLCEGPDKTGKNLIFRTPYMQQVIVPSVGEYDSPLQNIKITDANKCSLRGKIIN